MHPATYRVDGAAIRNRRMDLGLSIEDCAARAGITRPYLSQLELGHRREMRPPTYTALHTALDLPGDDRRLLAADNRKESHGDLTGAPE